MSSTTSSRSTISRDFDRTPSPRFFQRVDQSEEYGVYDILASPLPDFLQRIDEDNLSSASRLSDSIAELDPVRRTLIFSDDDKSVGSKTRRIPRHVFPSIAAVKGVGIGPRMTEAESSRQAYLDALVALRASTISTCSNADTIVFTNDNDSVVTIVERPTRKRSVSMAFLESEFGRMKKRVTKNSVLQCASCFCQHLVDASDSSRTCVFCGHSDLDEVDCNVAECIDDC